MYRRTGQRLQVCQDGVGPRPGSPFLALLANAVTRRGPDVRTRAGGGRLSRFQMRSRTPTRATGVNAATATLYNSVLAGLDKSHLARRDQNDATGTDLSRRPPPTPPHRARSRTGHSPMQPNRVSAYHDRRGHPWPGLSQDYQRSPNVGSRSRTTEESFSVWRSALKHLQKVLEGRLAPRLRLALRKTWFRYSGWRLRRRDSERKRFNVHPPNDRRDRDTASTNKSDSRKPLEDLKTKATVETATASGRVP